MVRPVPLNVSNQTEPDDQEVNPRVTAAKLVFSYCGKCDKSRHPTPRLVSLRQWKTLLAATSRIISDNFVNVYQSGRMRVKVKYDWIRAVRVSPGIAH